MRLSFEQVINMLLILCDEMSKNGQKEEAGRYERIAKCLLEVFLHEWEDTSESKEFIYWIKETLEEQF